MPANSLSDRLRLLAASLDRPSVSDALDTLMKTPGWEQKVKEWVKQDKTAGLGKSLIIPLAVAIMTLSQVSGAQTAEELISKIKNKSLEQTAPERISQADVDRMEKIIPYPLNRIEILALQAGELKIGPLKVQLTLDKFGERLDGAIKDGLTKTVFPQVKKDPKFSKMSKSDLENLIVKATYQKIENPQYAEGKNALLTYLQKRDKTLDYAKSLIKKSVGINLI
jgi:hypothetical protein